LRICWVFLAMIELAALVMVCVVYALFGSLGGKYIVKKPKLALISAAAIIVLSVVLGVTKVGKTVGSAYLFVGIGVCALFAALQIVREKRKQKAQEEEDRLAGIADTHTLDEQNTSEADDCANETTGNLADGAEETEATADVPEQTSVCSDEID